MPDHDEITEALLEKPCWVIDFLPRRVEQGSRGQFFEAERHFLKDDLFGRFAKVLLKLNCYTDFALYCEREWKDRPSPEELTRRTGYFGHPYVCILVNGDEALITADGDDSHMTVFGAGEELLELIRQISVSEGLFVWEGING